MIGNKEEYCLDHFAWFLMSFKKEKVANIIYSFNILKSIMSKPMIFYKEKICKSLFNNGIKWYNLIIKIIILIKFVI